MPLMVPSYGTDRPHETPPLAPPAERVSLGALFWLFLQIGSVAFGGFMALIAVIADTVVEKRQLLHRNDMLDGLSLANLLPGPQGVNCVAYVGYRLRGALGALVSVVGVLLPTCVLIVVLTALYVSYASNVPAVQALFAGCLPAVAAVMVSVVYRMGQNVLKGRYEVVLTLCAALILLAAPPALRLSVTLGLMCGFGLLGYALFRPSAASPPQRHARLPWGRILGMLTVLGMLVGTFLAQPPLAPRGLAQVALTLSGLSLLLFGGGYVFIPLLQEVVVTHHGWLTAQQFLDGLALSQVTPGPILVLATFIAQKVTMEQHGLWMGLVGALVGTVGIFTPPALLMLTASMALDALRHTPGVQAALRGIRCGVLGMISVAALVILQTSLPSWPEDMSMQTVGSYLGLLGPPLLILSAALVALVKYAIAVVWIIPVAGVLGFLLY